MSFKTITTFLHNPAAPKDAFKIAVDLARQFDAHLSVLVAGIDQTDPGFYYAGAESVILRENLGTARRTALRLEAEVEAVMSGEDLGWDVTVVSLQVGNLKDFLAENTLYCDLLVLPAPYGAGRGREDVAAVEAGLFDAGLPVLVVPDGHAGPLKRDRVLLAWNGGSEALAAARAALPFLSAAGLTEIAIIDPPPHAPDRSDPGGRLAQFIARHGGTAEIAVLVKSEPRIADILNRRASEMGFDLIVMGAYGHSRMREAIMGGATRRMLEEAKLPVLMAR